MVKFEIKSVDTVLRLVSVVYTVDKSELPVNLYLVGPVAGQIDMDDHDAVVAYLTEFGEQHYGGPPPEPHPLVGTTH